MPVEDWLAKFRESFLAFRKSPWFRVAYLVLLGLIVAQMFPLTIGSTIACLALLLTPLIVFVIPYWLGERRPRHLAANGLYVFLIAILVVALLETQTLLAQDAGEPLRSIPGLGETPGMALSNGTVTPFRGSPDQTFTFQVRLTTAENNTPTNFSVALNLTVIDGFARSSSSFPMFATNPSENTRNGTLFEAAMPLGGSIYGFGFSVTDGANWTFAGPVLGPITASGPAFYGFFLYVTALFMLIPFSFYYVILLMWWYTARMRQMRTRAIEPREIPREKPAPPNDAHGRASKAAAFTCTNCGADVTASDAKCPKCGAVFEE